jgi:hypothetical protein
MQPFSDQRWSQSGSPDRPTVNSIQLVGFGISALLPNSQGAADLATSGHSAPPAPSKWQSLDQAGWPLIVATQPLARRCGLAGR